MGRLSWIGAIALVVTSVGAGAQVRTIDPNQPVDADLGRPAVSTASQRAPDRRVPDEAPVDAGEQEATAVDAAAPPSSPAVQEARATATSQAADTYDREDLLGAGEGVFGKGAEGFAGVIERILKEQGRPNAYIAGREASGAFILGLRYGSGIMTHKVEGQQPVYWTGPSIGFDVGGDANKVFVLVYNLYDTEDLFERFPAAEGRLYFVGGFAVTYLRRGNVVLIPVRLGVGWRAGLNVGYMKFSHKNKWLPF
jgi:hypothetical protein